jgi:anti-sigma factor RsiW
MVAYLDHELSRSQASRLEAHIDTCVSCRDRLEVLAAFQPAPPEVYMPATSRLEMHHAVDKAIAQAWGLPNPHTPTHAMSVSKLGIVLVWMSVAAAAMVFVAVARAPSQQPTAHDDAHQDTQLTLRPPVAYTPRDEWF